MGLLIWSLLLLHTTELIDIDAMPLVHDESDGGLLLPNETATGIIESVNRGMYSAAVYTISAQYIL